MTKKQRVRDPLHNIIEFGDDDFESMLWNIIQTPEFQRLRRIKQLGFSEFVYPGATHTRFAHSLGVFHVARRLCKIIHGLQDNFNDSDERQQTVLAAALLHDVGHGPFSHAFEDVLKRMKFEHSHEIISGRIIKDSSIGRILSDFREGFNEEVARVITPGYKDIYAAVVSSQFDADRLDYILRDRMMTGTSLGMVDLEWLLSNLQIGHLESLNSDNADIETIDTLVIGAKGIMAVESFVVNLFQMYPTVYFHKTTRGIEKLFTELMILVFERICDDENGVSVNLPEQHPLVSFVCSLKRKKNNLNAIVALDDTVIMGALSCLLYAHDEKINSLAKRLLNRQVFKCIDIIERFNTKDPGSLKTIYNLMWNDILEWNASRSVDNMLLLDYDERSPYKKHEFATMPLVNQIWVKDNRNKPEKLNIRSDIVKAMDSYILFRAYVSERNNEAEQFLIDEVNKYSNVN